MKTVVRSAAVIAAGCMLAGAAAAAPERSLASYLHDLSPVIPGVTFANARLEHYAIPTSDGTMLDGWVRRPPGSGRQPLVIVFSPYYGGGNPSLAVNNPLGDPSTVFAAYLVPRGYAVGFISVGGTGDSGGCFHDGGAIERRQLADAVQYMAAQPWSNGAVGAIGVSYDGTTPIELFVEAPPALKTVVPMEGITDYYRYSFNNGNFRGSNAAFTTYYYALVGAAPVGIDGGVGPTDPRGFVRELKGEPCPEQVAIQQESVNGLATADKTPYWHERDAIELIGQSLAKPRPPVFYIEGFEDANVDPQMADGFLEALKKTGVPLHIWFGQWVHDYPQPFGGTCAAPGPCRGDFYKQALLAWFDQYLNGRNTGILDAPIMQSQADDGVWRHEDAWPPAAGTTLDFFPTAAGKLGKAPAAGTVTYKDATADTGAGAAHGTILEGTLLEFTSAPLAQPLRLTGLPRLETVAQSSGRIANLVATLMARNPDGTRRYLNFAALNLNHAASLDHGEPKITGKTLHAGVNFFAQDNVIPAGTTLVLDIGGEVYPVHTTSGDPSNLLNAGPNLMPLGIGARVTLDLAQTRLRLPVNGGDRVEPLSW